MTGEDGSLFAQVAQKRSGLEVKGQERSQQTYLRAERWTDQWPTTASNDLRPTEDE